jgi:repressor LexA
MLLGDIIKQYRSEHNISQRDFAKKCELSHTYIAALEKKIDARSGKKIAPTVDAVKNISKGLNMPLQELLNIIDDEQEFIVNQNKSIRIPVLGSIPAGIPMEMIEDIVDWEDISEEMLKGGKQYFALKIKGDSMFPEYLNGDVIIVLKQDDCESGQDCVVAVNGDDATFKRVFKTDNGITLQPLNNSYMPMFYSNDDVLNKPVKILGVVKQIRRNK